MYVNSLVNWNSWTGYNLWHDLRPNGGGATVVCCQPVHQSQEIINSQQVVAVLV